MLSKWRDSPGAAVATPPARGTKNSPPDCFCRSYAAVPFEFLHFSNKRKSPPHGGLFHVSKWRDSNPRPFGPERRNVSFKSIT